MGELVTVRGKVIGEAGKPVAGWVSLGKKHPQHWLAHVVRIESAEGQEISIDELRRDSIVSVVEREVAWRDIESDPLAQLCEREAPAPDVEIDFTTAVLRGGDEVVVWGEAIDYGPAQTDAHEGDFRTAPARTVTKIVAHVVATGDDREELVEKIKKRREQSTRDAEGTAKRRVAKEQKKRAAKKPASDTDYTNRLGWNWPLAVTLLALALVGWLGAHSGYHRAFLVAAAALCFLPLVADSLLLPPLRDRGLAPVSPDAPFVVFMLAGGFSVMIGFGHLKGDFEGAELRATVGSFAGGGVATACMLWVWLVTRKRRRYVSLMAAAPRHPSPMQEGVWGATDGRFSSEVMTVGEDAHWWGSGVKDSSGIKQRNVSTTPVKNIALQAPLTTANGETIVVDVGGAAILTLTRLDKSLGKDRARRADVINEQTDVRVVGRVRDGVMRRGGEASLLVFAAGPGGDVERDVRRLHRRLLAANLLIGLGVACYVAAFFVT